MPEIIKLKKKHTIKRKKVAAYCRVSTFHEDQEGSYTLQMAHYNKRIQSNPEWEFAGVYSDHGITGTSTRKRTGFQEMMKAADEGKIDLILTKSIKRFARNTVDLLEAVRHLKEIGVEVYFEQENIYSLSSDGDFMLTILASFAQEESRSLSENLKWTFKKKFESGDISVKRDCYGYHWNGETYEVIPEKAVIVKRIYREFLSGKGLIEIARQLNMDGIPMEKGGKWEFRMVRLILQNISYTGNVILQKYVNRDLKHSVINNGYEDQYFVPDTHEAIVSYEDWEKVQTMLHQHKANPESEEIQPFKGKVFCQETGLPYWHNAGYWHRKDKRIASWQGDPVVQVKSIPTYALQEAAQTGNGDLLRIEVKPDSSFDLFFSKEIIQDFHWTRRISLPPKTRSEQCKVEWSTRATSRWKGKSGSFCCFAKCGTCGKNYQSFPSVYDRRYRLSKCKHNPAFYQKDMETLVADVLGLDKFSEEVMDKELSHCVVNGKEVTFHFWDGRTGRRMLIG